MPLAAVVASSMFEALRTLFGTPRGPAEGAAFDPMAMAQAVLLLYAAQLDGSLDAAERSTVGRLIERRFAIAADRIDRLLDAADSRAGQATDLYSLTRDIKNGLGDAERTQMIEMLWEVVYADGTADAYETNLVRRVAGLLYVSDVESGLARQRVLDRLGLQDPAVADPPS